MIDISDDTKAVIEFIDHHSKHNLRKKNDLAILFEIAASYDNGETFSSIIFSGTSMWKVFSILRKTGQGAQGYKQLEQEFAQSMNQLRSSIVQLLEHAESDEVLQRFHDIYLGLGSGVIRNLADLAHDLTYVKEIQQEQKHSQ